MQRKRGEGLPELLPAPTRVFLTQRCTELAPGVALGTSRAGQEVFPDSGLRPAWPGWGGLGVVGVVRSHCRRVCSRWCIECAHTRQGGV